MSLFFAQATLDVAAFAAAAAVASWIEEARR
jgi:hypothetical protein